MQKEKFSAAVGVRTKKEIHFKKKKCGKEIRDRLCMIRLTIGSYQQHVANTAPVTKKWKSNTEIITKTACPALWSYLKQNERQANASKHQLCGAYIKENFEYLFMEDINMELNFGMLW